MEQAKEYYIFVIRHEPESQYPWSDQKDHYSSELMATAKYHEWVSALLKNSSFDYATVMLVSSDGIIMKMDSFACSYVPPEPEPEPEGEESV
jgi:hypothetical protein